MKIEWITDRELEVSKFSCTGPLVVLPYTRKEQAKKVAETAARRAGVDDAVLLAIDDQSRTGYVNLVNSAFKRTNSPWFGYMSQDAYAGRSWLSLAVESLEKANASLLGFNDGKWAGIIAAMGLARRTWAENNYDQQFFFGSYLRHYADAELTLLALQSKQYAYNPNSLLIEIDWKGDASRIHNHDKQTFLQRKSSGFDGKVSDMRLLGLFI